MLILQGIDVLTYTYLLIFAVINTVMFLIKQDKWKVFYISVFYVLTILLALLRITF